MKMEGENKQMYASELVTDMVTDDSEAKEIISVFTNYKAAATVRKI